METNKHHPLTLSTLIQELSGLLHKHGDLPAVIKDPDTGWVFLLKSRHLNVENASDSHGKRLSIAVKYGDERCD